MLKVVVPFNATFMDVKNEVLRVYRGINPSFAANNDIRYGHYSYAVLLQLDPYSNSRGGGANLDSAKSLMRCIFTPHACTRGKAIGFVSLCVCQHKNC